MNWTSHLFNPTYEIAAEIFQQGCNLQRCELSELVAQEIPHITGCIAVALVQREYAVSNLIDHCDTEKDSPSL